MSLSQKKEKSFFHEYEQIALLQSTYPLPYIMSRKGENFLVINVDQILQNEWPPILTALRKDTTLKYISLSSSWQRGKEDCDKPSKRKIKKPVLQTRSLTLQLSSSLKNLLSSNRNLECLVLQNIAFREADILNIAKGLSKSENLSYFSMENCLIRDKGFSYLMDSIKRVSSIVSINFTKCGLTWKSAEKLSNVIKHQGSQRHDVAWQASLRYRKPDLDKMHGLRRVTLCQNKIGDEGGRILADVLRDDLWLKAIDLQQCGLTTDSADILMETLRFNKTLVVLDLRNNSLISYNILRSMIEMVMVNAGGENSEFPWISSHDESKSNTSCLSTTKAAKKSKRQGRRKSLDGKHSKDHVPWRMAERARSRHSNTDVARSNLPYYTHSSDVVPENQQFCSSKFSNCLEGDKKQQNDIVVEEYNGDESEVVEELVPKHRSYRVKHNKRSTSLLNRTTTVHHHPHVIDGTTRREENTVDHHHDRGIPETRSHRSKHGKRLSSDQNYVTAICTLRDDLDRYQQELNEERGKLKRAEGRITELEEDNQVLRHSVEYYKTQFEESEKVSSSHKKKMIPQVQFPDLSQLGALENENALESIEASFKQFQQFLDMLKNLGLNDVCDQLQSAPSPKPQAREEKSSM